MMKRSSFLANDNTTQRSNNQDNQKYVQLEDSISNFTKAGGDYWLCCCLLACFPLFSSGLEASQGCAKEFYVDLAMVIRILGSSICYRCSDGMAYHRLQSPRDRK